MRQLCLFPTIAWRRGRSPCDKSWGLDGGAMVLLLVVVVVVWWW